MNVAHDFFFLTPETVLVTSSDNLDASIGFDGVLGRHPDQASFERVVKACDFVPQTNILF